jgi:hypothetical protein
VHSFADNILPQYRAQGGATVATTRKWRSAGALKLDISAYTVGPDNLAKKNGATVP